MGTKLTKAWSERQNNHINALCMKNETRTKDATK
jgi:hypothetical protein